ncbi:MAG: GDSL-type esterase/lipase family protein [Emcibacteraceae bacterium]|nr:GDSL-type esterase/lipase family protein [Emcibacteraceae bacterium]MDG1727335.1 GDSL-type esterase/lipase family protein [Emcibacteraceae bacterium]
MIKKLLLGVSLFTTFVYGIAVGAYEIFPFNEIKEIKELILEGNTLNVFETPYYLDKISFYKSISQSDYDVVFVGDSITDRSDWHDIFPHLTVANRGINSDPTEGVLNRLDTIVDTKAEKAFLMIGINDIGYGIDMDTIFVNYVKIIRALEKNNITPYVQSTLFTDGHSSIQKNVKDLNMRLRTFCKKNNIVFIDLNSQLSKKEKLKNIYSFDGVHLNGKGYEIWSKILLKYLSNGYSP